MKDGNRSMTKQKIPESPWFIILMYAAFLSLVVTAVYTINYIKVINTPKGPDGAIAVFKFE